MKKGKKRTWILALGIICSVLLMLGIVCTGCSGSKQSGVSYTVHFETNCSSKTADRTYVTGTTFALPTPYNFGYQLEGWYYDDELTEIVEAENNVASELNVKKYADKNKELTLYAGWKIGEYKLVFDTDTDETIGNITLKVGETVELPVPADQVKGTSSYPFSSWYYAAAGTYHTDTFTLTYPEDVYLTAKYDYGVLSTWTVDENGRYSLASSTKSVTDVAGYDMAYGTVEADLTIENFTCTACGLIWNVDLSGASGTPWETGVSYYYYHINPSSGAMQLAYVSSSGSYVGLKTLYLADNATGFAESYPAAKEAGSGTFRIKVVSDASGISLYIDDELQISVSSSLSTFVGFSGTGVGFRAATQGVYFSDLSVEASSYQITFDANGGSLDPDYVRYAIDEETGKATVSADALPVPSRAGWQFLGWLDSEGHSYTGGELEGSITLYAEWSQLSNGALITIDANNDTDPTERYTANGEAVGELPAAEKLGFTLVGWYYLDGTTETEVTAETVFAEDGYSGDTKLITVYAKWTKDEDVETTDVTLTLEKGRYTVDEDYDGYTAYTAGVGSLTTFENVTLSEGKYSVYVKFASSGANGIIFGATIASDFGDNCDANYMLAGSSYYYWHINNATGVWQLAKVTDSGNEETQNTSSPGYDVLASGTLSGFTAGARYLLTVEIYDTDGGRYIILYVNGVQVSSVDDSQGVGGAALTGTQLGFRNAGGGATYYGISVVSADELGGYEITLDAGRGTVNGSATLSYVRPEGWSILLPSAELEGSDFVGWTTVKNDSSTLFSGTVMKSAYNGLTLYAYYLGSNEVLVYYNTNGGGTTSAEFIVVTLGDALTSDQLAAPTEKPGYEFEGWYTEDGTAVTTGYTVAGSMTLYAKWSATVTDAGKVTSSVSGEATSENDGVYDVYTVTDAMLAVFDKTLDSGTLSLYVTYSSGSGVSGIVFGGTDLKELTSSALPSAGATCYYWYVDPASGTWILYKFVSGSNSQIKNTTWADYYGSAWALGTYEFTVKLVKNDDGSLTITLYVDGHQFLEYTDSDPLEGTDIGFRNNTNSTSTSFYGLNVVSATDMEQGTLTLNAGEGTVDETTITRALGWTFILPTASRTGYTFLGWATAEEGEVVYTAGTQLTMSEDFAGATLYAVYTDKAVITYETSVGTAPSAVTVTIGDALTSDQLAAPTEKPGYEFEGWYTEDGTEVTTSYTVTGSMTLYAKWSATVTDAGKVTSSISNRVTSENDGVYDVYTVTDAMIAVFDKTLDSGTLSLYVTYTSDSGKCGIVFCAKNLGTINSVAMSNSDSDFYYWYVNPETGGWILYKVVEGSTAYTQLNGTSSDNTTWANYYGSAWALGTYELSVKLVKNDDDSLTITLYVNGTQFFTYTDSDPLKGTDIGFLQNADNTKYTSFYGLNVVADTNSAAAEISEITLYCEERKSY